MKSPVHLTAASIIKADILILQYQSLCIYNKPHANISALFYFVMFCFPVIHNEMSQALTPWHEDDFTSSPLVLFRSVSNYFFDFQLNVKLIRRHRLNLLIISYFELEPHKWTSDNGSSVNSLTQHFCAGYNISSTAAGWTFASTLYSNIFSNNCWELFNA